MKRTLRGIASRARRRWIFGAPLPGAPAVTDSILQWCRSTGPNEVVVLHPADRIIKNLPSTIEEGIDSRYTRHLVIYVGPRYLARLPGAALEVPSGCTWPAYTANAADRPRVVLPDSTVSLESTQGFLNPSRPSRRKARPMSGGYFSLLTAWSLQGNYYHWVHDVLIRLHSVLPHLPGDVRFIVSPQLLPYQVESLELLGINRSRLVAFDGPNTYRRMRPWRFDDLYYCPLCEIDAQALVAFRSFILDRIRPAANQGSGRIYISRRDSSYRRVINEAQVTSWLEKRGYEVHVLGGMTFADQVSLFANAEVIIGPHGAGMTNMIFAPPGTTLIEIQTTEVGQYFHNLSVPLGQKYWYFFGIGRVSPTTSLYGDDIIVPMNKLATSIRRALG